MHIHRLSADDCAANNAFTDTTINGCPGKSPIKVDAWDSFCTANGQPKGNMALMFWHATNLHQFNARVLLWVETAVLLSVCQNVFRVKNTKKTQKKLPPTNKILI
jgi:hypothetical protein